MSHHHSGNSRKSVTRGTNGNDVIDVSAADRSQRIYSRDGDDLIVGSDHGDRIDAGDGNNTIHAGDGNDRIRADDGDNVIDAGEGRNDVRVDDGDSTITTGSGRDRIRGDDGDFVISSGAGDDRITLDDGNNLVNAGDGDDDVRLDDGNNTVSGGAGDDRIRADNGDNSISGGDGDDRIKVGNGTNTIEGGAGDDEIQGGKGFDTAVFAGSILDFAIDFQGHDDDDDDDDDDCHDDDDDDHGHHHGHHRGEYLTVTDLVGDQGTDTLHHIDALQFDDYTLYLDGRNNPPLVLSLDQSVDENDAVTYTVVAVDFDGGAVSLDSVTAQTSGGDDVSGKVSVVVTDPAFLGGLGVQYAVTLDTATGFDELAVGETETVTVSYSVSDGQGGTSVHSTDVVVNGENDAPELAAGTLSATEDGGAVVLDLSALGDDIDSDDDGASLTYTLATSPAEGSATISGSDLTFDPGAGFQYLSAGQTIAVSFDVTATDQHGASVTNTVTVTVTGTNDAPVAAADDNSGDAVVEAGSTDAGDPSATGNVLTNDSDVDLLDVLAVSGVAAGAGLPSGAAVGTAVAGTYGALTLGSDGLWTYALDNNNPATDALVGGQVVTDVFTYEISDGQGGTDGATLTITITGADDNLPPVATDSAVAGQEDNAISGVANTTDPDVGDVLSHVVATGPTNGSVVMNPDGTFTYTPNAHFSGTDSFGYTVSDLAGDSDSATVTITVEAVADAPVVTLGCSASDTPAAGSSEIAVNSTTAGTQSYAKLAALAGGGFVAVWRSTPQDANSYAVVGRVFDNAGTPTGAEFIVNSNETGSQTFGEVTALADGGFVVTWSDQTGDSDSWGVKEQRFDATGTAIGSETLVNTTETARQYLSDSAGLVGGGHVAVWESLSGDADAGGIVARVFDAGGTGGTEIAVNSYTTDDQRFAQVAGTSDGGFVVSWGSFGQDGDNWGIYAQRYDASGAAVGAEFQVNDITADSQRYSHVAGLEGGGFVIAYTSQGQDTDGGSVHAQLYDASGTPIGGVVQVNCSEAGTQNYPYVAALDDGGYVITWNSFGTDGDSYGIFAQRYDASGTPVGPETRLSDTSAGSQYNYGLIGGDATAQLSDGNIVTVWDQDINTGEIFARIVSPDALANLEDQPMPVDVTAALVDQDGSESLSVTLSGFPAGATFNLGAASGSDWLIDGADLALLDTLEMTPPAHWNGSFTLTATGTATEASNGDTASTTASTLLTILPVNDAPQADDQTIEVPEQTSATMPVSTVGQLTASDNDAGDTQTWTAGSFATANGTVTIAADGSFDYTPNFGFLGVDSFSATVTDGAGATDTADVRIEVATESFTSPGGQGVTLDLNADATAGAPAGNVSVNLTPFAAPSINVLFAMDASGSVGSSGWTLEKQAVISAIQTINTQFATSGIDVDIQVFSFGGTQNSIGGQPVPYGARGSLDVLGGASGPSLPGTELQDFDLATQYTQLLNGVSAMNFTSGTTPWALAFAQAEDWFASEADPNAFNLMYFLTDGNPYPSSQNWQTPLQSLQATGADIQAFGVGSSLNQALLDTVDSDGQATPVTNFAALTAALQDSALFPAELVSLDVTLDADGTSLGVIADETNPAVSASSLSVDLALADISGIEQMLGAQNEFGVSAVFDLDGNLATTADQVTLNSVELIGLGVDAVTVAGTAGNDLLLASTDDDVMTGGDGNDLLIAGSGADTVFGDNGDDRIRGGEGNDALAGGLGSDTFLFASGDGADSVQDYDAATDAITFDGGLTFGDLTIAQAGTDVTISYGLDMITVVNALATDFVQAEFNFL